MEIWTGLTGLEVERMDGKPSFVRVGLRLFRFAQSHLRLHLLCSRRPSAISLRSIAPYPSQSPAIIRRANLFFSGGEARRGGTLMSVRCGEGESPIFGAGPKGTAEKIVAESRSRSKIAKQLANPA